MQKPEPNCSCFDGISQMAGGLILLVILMHPIAIIVVVLGWLFKALFLSVFVARGVASIGEPPVQPPEIVHAVVAQPPEIFDAVAAAKANGYIIGHLGPH